MAALMKDELLTIEQAANLLNVSTKTMRRWDMTGKLSPQRTVGNHRRYSKSEIEAFKQQRGNVAPETGAEIPAASSAAPTIQAQPGAQPNLTPPSMAALLTTPAAEETPEPVAIEEPGYQEPAISLEEERSGIHLPNINLSKRGGGMVVTGLVSMIFLVLVAVFNVPQVRMFAQGHSNVLSFIPGTKQPAVTLSTDSVVAQRPQNNQEQLFNLKVNVPAIFGKKVTFLEDGEVKKTLKVDGKLIAPNVVYSITAGQNVTISGDPQNPVISASLAGLNGTVLSVQGKTGDVQFLAGDGLTLAGTTITNSDPGSAQTIFKNFTIDGTTTIIADANDDTINFAAGSGVTLSGDASTKTITITSNAGGLSGLTTNGVLYANSPTDVSSTSPPIAGQVLLGNASGVPTFTALSGDLSVNGNGVVAISPDSVMLGTDTVGNYQLSTIAGNGITVSGSAGEGWSPTIGINLPTSGTTSTTTSNSGLEVTAGGLSLLRGCGSGQILKWNSISGAWECNNDSTGSGGSGIGVISGNSFSSSDSSTLNFSNEFALNESPLTQTNVSLDYTTSHITRDNQNQTITGIWNFASRLGVGASNPTATLDVQGNYGSNAAAIINQQNSGNILVASSSGTTRFIIANNGALTATGPLSGLTGLTSSGTITFSGLANGVVHSASGVLSSSSVLNSELQNSSVTINTGTGLSGGGSVALGASLSLTNTGVTSLAGTANQVTVSGATGAITLSLPQDINTSSSPTFNGLTVSSLTRGTDTITDFTGTGLQVVGNALEATLGTSVDLASEITGTLGPTNGGTGLTSYTTGDLIYASAANTLAKRAIGTSGQILTVSGGLPTWVDAGGSINFWQRANGAIAPLAITDDLLLGSTATGSAKFSISGTTGDASSSGNLTFNSAATVQTTKNQTLTFGGNSTGNIVFSPLNGSGTVTINGDLNLASTKVFQINGSNVLTATTLGTSVVNSSLTSVATLNAGAISSGFGNIDVGADSISGGDFTSSGTTGYTASGNGAGFTFSGSGNHDITATSGTLRLGPATLTGAITGNNQSVTGLNALSAGGAITFGSFTSNGGVLYTNGSGVVAQATAGSANQVLHGGTTPSFGAVSLTGDVSGTLPIANGGTNTGSIGSAGTVAYSTGTAYGFSAVGSAGQVFLSGGAGAPTWVDPSTLGTNYFQRNLGVLSPLAITDDLAVGGTATSSAKFQIFGLNGNATTSGTLTFNTAGTVQTTKNQTLTFGGNSTGNIVFSPLNGSGTVTVNGNLNLASGDVYQINGTSVLSNNTLGSGVTTSSLTTVGALASGSIASGFGTIATANSISGSTLGIAGTTVIDNSRNAVNLANLTASGTITFSGLGQGIAHLSSGGVLSSSAVNLATETTGTLGPTNGGTGLGSYSVGDLLYASGVSTLASRAIGSAGQILTVSGGVPIWMDAGGTVNFWQRGNGVVAPLAITDDLAVGGTATSSAKFQVFGLTGNATTSGNLTFNSAATVQTTKNQTLTIGGSSTGNIVFSPLNGAGTVSVNGIMNLASGNVYQINGTSVLSNNTLGSGVTTSSLTTVGALASGSLANGFGTIATNNSISGSSLGISGTTVIDSSRNLSNIAGVATDLNPTTTNSRSLGNSSFQYLNVYGQTLYQNGNQVCDTTGNCSGLAVNYWNQTNGAIVAKNSTVDLLVGGTSSDSAKFAVLNINSGTPTASVSAIANGGAYLTASGTLATTNKQTLTLGSASTGNIALNGFGAGVLHTNASGVLSSGNVNLTTEVTGTLGPTNGGTGLSSYASGDLIYASASNTLSALAKGADGQVLSLAGGLPSWISTSSLNYWQRNSGAIAPLNITDDLLLGSTATGSAKFAFKNVAGGTPTASISAGLAGGVYLDATGLLATTNKQSLTLGDANTGNILLSGGNVGIGVANPSYKLDVNGAINAVSYRVNGFIELSQSGNNFLLNNNGQSNSSLLFYAGAAQRGIFDTSGNFGINSTSPVAALDVRATSGTTSVASVSGATSFAGLVVDQSGVGDIFTASKSGATRFIIANDGTLTASKYTAGIAHFSASGVVSSSSVALGSEVTGTLGPTNGGTGLSSYTTGDLIYASGSNTLTNRAIGTAGQILTVSGGLPTWVDAGGSINFWQRGNGVISPLAITDDLAVGGTATSSAKFQIFGLTGNATTSGTLTFNTAGSVQTTNNRTLTLGGNSTGNIVFSPLNGAGTVSVNGIVNLASGNVYQINGTSVLSNNTLGSGVTTSSLTTVGALASGSIANGFGTIATNNSISGSTLGIGGTTVIDNSRFLTNIAGVATDLTPTTNNTRSLGTGSFQYLNVYGQNLYQNGNQVCDTTGNCSGLSVNFWNQTNGALVAKNSTVDLLVGGTSSDSAKFAVLNMNSGTPTASVSAIANGGAYLTASGTLATTNKQTLTLGSASTGNIALNGFGAGVLHTNASGVLSSGNVNLGSEVTGTLGTSNGGTGFNTYAQGDLLYGNGSGGLSKLTLGGPSQYLAAVGGNLIWQDVGGSINFFQKNAGVIAPFSITDDFAVGGIATNSAKFQIFGLNGNATTSGTLTFNTTGTVQTTNNQTLTFGGNSTGNIVFSPLNGSGTVTVNGNLNLATGDVYQINGTSVLSNNTLGSGVTTSSLTTVGALASGSIANGFGTIATANAISGSTLGIAGTTVIDNSRNAVNLANITATGTITFSGLGQGIAHLSSGGVLSSSAVNLGSEVTSTLGPTNGGTGLSSYASGDLIYASASNTLSALAKGVDGQVLSLASGLPSWISTSSINYWQRATGAIAPLNITDDLLLGSTATGSARFAFKNVASGTPVASISAGTSGALTLSADGVVGTTAKQSLTLGDANTGNLVIGTSRVIISGIGSGIIHSSSLGVLTSSAIALGSADVSGTLGVANGGTGTGTAFTQGSLVFAGASGVYSQNNSNFFWDNTNLRLGIGTNSNLAAALDVRSTSGTAPAASISGATAMAGLVVDQSGVGDIFTASKSGATKFVITNAGNVGIGTNTPAALLHIEGTSGGTIGRVLAGPIGNNLGAIGFASSLDSTNFALTGSSAITQLNGPSALTMNIGTNEKARFDSSGNLGIGTNFGTVAALAKLDVRGAGSATLPIASFSGATNFAAAVVDQSGSGDIFTASKSGASKFTVLNNGNVKINNYTTAGGLLYTDGSGNVLQTANGTGTQCLLGGAGGSPTWGSCSTGTTNYWQQNSGSLAPATVTDKLVLGGGTTTNHQLEVNGKITGKALVVLNETGNQDIFTASASGTTRFTITNAGDLVLGATTRLTQAGVGTFANNTVVGTDTFSANTITDSGALTVKSAAGANTLTLQGGTTTGNIQFFSGSNTITSGGALTLAGNVSLTGSNPSLSSTSTNRLDLTGNGATLSLGGVNGTVGIGTTSPLATFDVRGNSGTTPVASVAGTTAQSALVVDQSGVGDLFTASKSGATKFTILNNGNIALANYSNCGALTTVGTTLTCSGTPAGTNFWQLNSGTVSPFSNTLDVLIGGVATNSAKFAFYNVNAGTPTASISANTTNNATFLTGDGTLSTTNAQTLTLGGASTGNITLSPAGGSGTVNSTGNLSLASGKAFQIAGSGNVLSASTLGTTVLTSSLTTVGALNAGSITNGFGAIDIGNDNLTAGGTITFSAIGSGVVKSASGVLSASAVGLGSADVSGTLGVANGGTGTGTAFTQGSVVFAGASGVYSQDNSNFFFDDTLNRFGVGVNSNLLAALDVRTTSGTAPAASISGNTAAAGLVVDNSGTGDIFTASSSGLNRFVIKQNGNVLVGTTTQTAQSHKMVITSTDYQLALVNASNNSWGFTNWDGTNGLYSQYNGLNRMYLSSTGSLELASGLAGSAYSPLATFDVRANSGTTPVASVSGATALAAAVVDQSGVGDIFTASKSGATKFTILNNGNIQANNYTTAGGLLYTNGSGVVSQTANGTATQCLLGGAGGAPTWGSCATGTTNFWQELAGALSPSQNIGADLLLGGTATSSAKFAFTGNNGTGTPTASISGSTANVATYLTGDGTLGTTKATTLTLGSSSTGNVVLAPGGVTALTAAGANLTGAGTFTSTGLITASAGLTSTGTTNINQSGAGATVIGNASSTTTLNLGSDARSDVYFRNASGNLARLAIGASGTVLTSNGASADPSWTAGYVNDATNGTLTRTGSGPYTLGLNLGSVNTWTGGQTFNAGATVANNSTLTVNSGSAVNFAHLGSANNSVLYADNTSNGVLTKVTATSTANQCLLSGATSPSWGSCDTSPGVNLWQVLAGALSPKDITSDVLFGGTATSSAKFAFTGVNAGTPTASVSAGTAGAAYLNATGTLATTARQSLTLGDGNTGNIQFFSGSNTITSAGALTLASNLTVNGTTVNLGNGSSSTIQTSSNAGLTLLSSGTGNITLGQNTANGTVVIQPNAGGQAALIVNKQGSNDIFTASAAGTTRFTIANNGDIRLTAGINLGGTVGTGSQCLLGGASAAWGACGGSNTNFWQDLAGAISPATISDDLLLGGTATNSAKFAFTGNNGTGTPTASISAGLAGAINLTATGVIGTTANQSLTLGSASTGNLVFAPGGATAFTAFANGRIGVGTTSPLATLDVRGNLGTIPVASVAGVTAQAAMVVDNSGVGDIFTASKSGATKFTIQNSGTVVIGTTTNGIVFDPTGTNVASGGTGIYQGTARPFKTITLSPEFAGAVLTASGAASANTNGIMTSDASPSASSSTYNFENYYQWVSSQSSGLMQYTVAVRTVLPQDFGTWATSGNAISMDMYTNLKGNGSNKLDLKAIKASNGSIVVYDQAQASGATDKTWITRGYTSAQVQSLAAGDTVVFYVTMYSKDSNDVMVGDIKLNYLSKF